MAKGNIVVNILQMLPLFLVVLIIYLFVMALPGDINGLLENKLIDVKLASGADWALEVGHLIIIGCLFILFIELFKATSTGTATTIEHAFSMFTFIAYILIFILVEGAGNSTFFIIAMMSLVDVVAGFTITITAARRDFGVGHGFGGGE